MEAHRDSFLGEIVSRWGRSGGGRIIQVLDVLNKQLSRTPKGLPRSKTLTVKVCSTEWEGLGRRAQAPRRLGAEGFARV